jgi:GNAT superfamily N-acetyltransferase
MDQSSTSTLEDRLKLLSIPAEATLRIRQQVLWPDHPPEFSRIEIDSDGEHFGACVENSLVGVVSIFREGEGLRFRKLAVLPKFQRSGIGRFLIEAIKLSAKNEGVKSVRCDARASACEFYKRCGFVAEGEPFLKYGNTYLLMVYATA